MKLALIFFFFILSTVAVQESGAELPVVKASLLTAGNEAVEYLWSQPPGNGPWPVLVLIHPHQEWPNKIGAEIFEKNQWKKARVFWVIQLVVISVSLVGVLLLTYYFTGIHELVLFVVGTFW